MRIPNIARAGLQSGAIMSLADAFTQVAVERKDWDSARSSRWLAAGLTLHGPYFFLGFRRIDNYFGAATSFSMVLKKTAAAQFVLFPPYLVLLFSYLGFMEGVSNVPEKVKSRVPEAFVGGCVFWPIANGINFAIVPNTMRVPYLALSAGAWNSYLSWTNARRV